MGVLLGGGVIMHDLRFAARSLLRSPGFSLAAAAILALGLGSAIGIFSVLDALLLRPLAGIPRPAELVSLETVRKGTLLVSTSYPDFRDYRDSNHVFASIAARIPTWSLLGGEPSTRVAAEVVSGDYFRTLELQPHLGHFYDGAVTDTPGAPAVAVISYGCWRSVFGADPRIIGRVVDIDAHPFEIVGVTPPGFHGTYPQRSTDVFVPLGHTHVMVPHLSAGVMENRASLWLAMFARRKSGTTIAQAQSDINFLAGQISQAHPVTNEGRTVNVVPGLGFDSEDRATLRRFLLLLLGVAGLLLGLICANVANMFLARGVTRRREFAIRLALGASRSRLLRPLLGEALLLSGLGICGAAVVAPAILAIFQKLPRSFVGFETFPAVLDARVAAFAAGVAALGAIALVVAPSRQATNVEIFHAMKESAAASPGSRSLAARLLVLVQIVISIVLLVGATLMVRSVGNALAEDAGYRAGGVFLANVDLGLQGYSREQGLRLYRSLMERLRVEPGVRAASLAQTTPSNGFVSKISLFPPGQVPPREQREGRLFDLGVRTDFDPVAPGYFDAMSIGRLRGRDFNDNDNADAPRVCIVSASLARRLWPDRDPVGQMIAWPPDNGPEVQLQVVGVVADVRHRSPIDTASLMVYMPLAQEYDARANVIVRFAGDAASARAALTRAAHVVDPRLSVFSSRTLAEQVRGALWQQRSAARLIGVFATMAMALGLIGLYALVSYMVARRTREFAIRTVLGATRGRLRLDVLRQFLPLLWSGVAVGLAAAAAATRLMSQLLVGVKATDVLTFGVVSLVASAVGIAAILLPARRATVADPSTCLRND